MSHQLQGSRTIPHRTRRTTRGQITRHIFSPRQPSRAFLSTVLCGQQWNAAEHSSSGNATRARQRYHIAIRTSVHSSSCRHQPHSLPLPPPSSNLLTAATALSAYHFAHLILRPSHLLYLLSLVFTSLHPSTMAGLLPQNDIHRYFEVRQPALLTYPLPHFTHVHHSPSRLHLSH